MLENESSLDCPAQHARSMLLLALKEAARYGWQLAASADVSAKYVHQENGPDYPADVHSWFFCYQGSVQTLFQGQILLDQYKKPRFVTCVLFFSCKNWLYNGP